MADIILSLGIFGVSMMLHLGLCRTVLPSRMPLRMAAVLPVAAAGLAVYDGLAVRIPDGNGVRLFFSSGAMYLLLMMTYFVFFGNAALESPTQAVVMYLRRQGTATLEDLRREVNDQRFIMSRLESLVRNGLAVEENGHYRLAAKGRAMAWWLNLYARLLGRKAGG